MAILHETIRQTRSKNKVFVDLLHRLRTGRCDDNDYSLVSRKTLGVAEMPGDNLWNLAPIVITSNATRDAVNQVAEAFTEQTGSQTALVPCCGQALEVHCD